MKSENSIHVQAISMKMNERLYQKLSYDHITPVPYERWSIDDNKSTLSSRFGFFLLNIESFDTEIFRVSPPEATLMDPQQRILLSLVYNLKSCKNVMYTQRTGVTVGISGSEYGRLASAVNVYTATGGALSVASGRISYIFGLQGICVSVDTACSSSLVGLHLAISNMVISECDASISCGSNVTLSNVTTEMFNRAGMLSIDGRCKVLDAKADGYVRGEACVALFMNTLKNSEESMHGPQIGGSATNQDGRSSSLTAPNGPSQQRVIRSALQSDEDALIVRMEGIELHGTGTSLGDPIEVGAICAVFTEHSQRSLVVSAAKSFVGHTEPASGIVGLIFSANNIQARSFQTILHLQTVNFYLVEVFRQNYSSKSRSGEKGGSRDLSIFKEHAQASSTTENKVARGISAFAFQGTNAHIILSAPAVIHRFILSNSSSFVMADFSAIEVLNLLSLVTVASVPAYDFFLFRVFYCFDNSEKRRSGILSTKPIIDIVYEAISTLSRNPFFHHLVDIIHPLEITSTTRSLGKILEIRTNSCLVSLGCKTNRSLHFRCNLTKIDYRLWKSSKFKYKLIVEAADERIHTHDTQMVAQEIDHSFGIYSLYSGHGEYDMKCETNQQIISIKFFYCSNTFIGIKCFKHYFKRCLNIIALRSSTELFGLYGGVETKSNHGHAQNTEQASSAKKPVYLYHSLWIVSHISRPQNTKSLSCTEGRNLSRKKLHVRDIIGALQNTFFQHEMKFLSTSDVPCTFSSHNCKSCSKTACLDGILESQQNERRDLKIEKLFFDSFVSKVSDLPHLSHAKNYGNSSYAYAGSHMCKEITQLLISNNSNLNSYHSLFPNRCLTLITGGLGTIGKLMFTWMSNQCMSGIVLSSRIGRSSSLPRDFKKSETIMYIDRQDISDSSASLYPRGENEKNPSLVSSAFQVAGILFDCIISNQNVLSIASVQSPKVQGTTNMMKALYSIPIRSITLFSSLASLLGTAGQANYVAFNRWLDSKSLSAGRTGMSLISLQWGIWNTSNGGMVHNDANILGKAKRYGIDSFTSGFGLLILQRILLSIRGLSVLCINKFNWINIFVNPREKNKSNVPHVNNYQRMQHLKTEHKTTKIDIATGEDNHHKIEAHLLKSIEKVLGHSINRDDPLIDAGLDSLALVELNDSIESELNIQLPSTAAFDYPTVAALAIHIDENNRKNHKQKEILKVPEHLSKQRIDENSISILGLGLRFAGIKGDIQSLKSISNFIENAGDAIVVVPQDRWEIDIDRSCYGISYRRDPDVEPYSRHGSFINDIDSFDIAYFNITYDEASSIDPQQRMILKTCSESIFISNLQLKDIRGSDTAVFIGICNNDYDAILRENIVKLSVDENSTDQISTAVGAVAYSTYAFASNRVSHMFGMMGASISLDCASASGLVAVHMAILNSRSKTTQNIDKVDKTPLLQASSSIAGSVNLILHSQLTDLHTARKMFPNDGRCKTFDSRADGFERGEGVGTILLQQNFSKEGNVLGVIRGSSTIHKGGGASLRALRGPAIVHKLQIALSDSLISRHQIKYIEASGLGEPFGDAIEIGAYKNLFAPQRYKRNVLVFGSIHTNIGHLDGASGIASILKILSCTQTIIGSPIVHFRKLHPLICGRSGKRKAESMGHTWHDVDIRNGFLSAKFPMCKIPIIDEGKASPAFGVSSFGFGGTMAHVILQSPHPNLIKIPRVLCVAEEVHIFRHRMSKEDDVKLISFEILSSIETSIMQVIRCHTSKDSPIGRCSNFFEIPISLKESQVHVIENDLRKIMGMHYLQEGIMKKNPSISRLSVAILHSELQHRFHESFGLPSLVKSWMKNQVSRHIVHSENSFESCAYIKKLERPIVFVLASPRSGSTLTQLMLNANPHLFAPQELYLLQFYTMSERLKNLSTNGLDEWIFEGLKKVIKELCKISGTSEIQHFLDKLNQLNIVDVYDLIQTWAGCKILVDKTPSYIWSIQTLRRAEEIFENAKYVFLCRHPLSNIMSMSRETIKREWLHENVEALFHKNKNKMKFNRQGFRESIESSLWNEAEYLWTLGNSNAIRFLNEIDSDRSCNISYESLITSPEMCARQLCTFIGVPYHTDMSMPYTKRNMESFSPAKSGGLSAADPNLLKKSQIEAGLVDVWRTISPVSNLKPFTVSIAQSLRYEIPRWIEIFSKKEDNFEVIKLNKSNSGPIYIFIHDITGGIELFKPIGAELRSMAFGLRVKNWDNLFKSLDIGSLALFYRKMLKKSLSLSSDDCVIFCGVGIGLHISIEIAIQQSTACSTSHKIYRTWENSRERGEPHVVGVFTFRDGSIFEHSKKQKCEKFLCHIVQNLHIHCANKQFSTNNFEVDALRRIPQVEEIMNALREEKDIHSKLGVLASFKPINLDIPRWDERIKYHLILCKYFEYLIERDNISQQYKSLNFPIFTISHSLRLKICTQQISQPCDAKNYSMDYLYILSCKSEIAKMLDARFRNF